MRFQSTLSGDVLTLTVPPLLASVDDAPWQDMTSAWLMEPAELYVLDFAGTEAIDRGAYRNLVEFCRVLETG